MPLNHPCFLPYSRISVACMGFRVARRTLSAACIEVTGLLPFISCKFHLSRGDLSSRLVRARLFVSLVKPDIPAALLKRIQEVQAKRPKTVLEHILAKGHITTEELKDQYGYNHPPRAARDVREHGILLETFRVTGGDGRKIAAYRLNLNGPAATGKTGRQAFPKKLKIALLEKFGSVCAVCCGTFDPTFLQVDHRVPYEVGGDSGGENPEAYMLVCASCNRSKSWACEHCENWKTKEDAKVCKSCYWSSPTNYSHVALVNIRRADITWSGDDVKFYEKLKAVCAKENVAIQDGVRKLIRDSLK
jgi:hypothetical protein